MAHMDSLQSEISQKKNDKEAWVVIDGGVYDVTGFLGEYKSKVVQSES